MCPIFPPSQGICVWVTNIIHKIEAVNKLNGGWFEGHDSIKYYETIF